MHEQNIENNLVKTKFQSAERKQVGDVINW